MPNGVIASACSSQRSALQACSSCFRRFLSAQFSRAASDFLLWRRMGMTLLGPDQAGRSAPPDYDTCHRDHLPGGRDTAAGARSVLAFSASIRAAPCRTSRQILCCLVSRFKCGGGGTQGTRDALKRLPLSRIAGIAAALLINVPGGPAYYFVNVGTWTAIVFVCAYGGAFLERTFSQSLACRDLLSLAILLVAFATEGKRKSAYRLGALFAELQATGPAGYRRKRRRRDDDRPTPCRTFDTRDIRPATRWRAT